MSFFEVQDPFLKCHKSSLCVAKLKWLLRILDSSVAWDRHWMSWVVTSSKGSGMQNRWFQCPHGLELLQILPTLIFARMCFNALSGLSCYTVQSLASAQCISFNALTGLSCYERVRIGHAENNGFNALTGLSCYGMLDFIQNIFSGVSMPSRAWVVTPAGITVRQGCRSFNALTGLSCYGKNVQYFKFFMILFYTYLLFIGVY